MVLNARLRGLAVLAPLLALAVSPAMGREEADAPAHASALRTCRDHAEDLVAPGARIADRAAFCACYAAGAVEARLWALEQAEANVGQEVRQPVADRTIRLHDAKSAAVAAACLTR